MNQKPSVDQTLKSVPQVLTSDKSRTFTVATDDAVITLIEDAQARLVVIAPALSRAVADALAARFDDLDHL